MVGGNEVVVNFIGCWCDKCCGYVCFYLGVLYLKGCIYF